MAPNTLTELLKLPSGDRAELAMALWASLDDASRGTELALTPERITEGGVVLLAHVLRLLVTLIGVGLTAREIDEIWPIGSSAAFKARRTQEP